VASSAAVVALTLGACSLSDRGGTAGEAAVRAPPPTPGQDAPRGVVEDCATRSLASFPGAFTDPDNVVVGPLALVGSATTPPETVREVGGEKFPALVRAGHRVTVALPRRVAGLGYGPLPEGSSCRRETAIGS
jgi:hypothetical protein